MDARQQNEGKVCSVAGCGRSAVAKGLCKSHYDRLRDYGSAEHLTVRMNTTKCRAEGCDELARQKGLCDKHYQRLRSNGDPNHIPAKPQVNGGSCLVPGCGKVASTRGYCQAHYGALKRHGDPTVNKRSKAKNPEYVKPPMGPRPFYGPCSVLGCGNVATRSGKCRRHGRLAKPSSARAMLSPAALAQIFANRDGLSVPQLAKEFLTTPRTVVAVQAGRKWGYRNS